MLITNALVFTKSAESTLRLARLLRSFKAARSTGHGNDSTRYTQSGSESVIKPAVVQDYSSDSNGFERESVFGNNQGAED